MNKMKAATLALGLTSALSVTASAMAQSSQSSLYLTVSDFILIHDANTSSAQPIAMGEWEGHSAWKAMNFDVPEDFGPTNMNQPYELVLQLNVSSTNKSKYNALYLNPEGFTTQGFNGCDDAQNDRYESERMTYLPEVAHDHWAFYHRTFHFSKLRPGRNVLLICARNSQGGGWGELDNFYLKDIVLHYRKRIPFSG